MAKSESKSTKAKRLWLPSSLAVGFSSTVVLVCLASFPFADLGGPPDLLSVSFVFTLGFLSSTLALGSLVAIWCSLLGRLKIYLIGGAVLLVAGFALTLRDGGGGPQWWLVTLLPLAIASPTCLTMEFIKLIFGEFSKISSDDQVYEEGLQFKLSHLFIVTTVIAVLFGVGQAVNEFVGGIENLGSAGLLKTLSCITAVLVANTLFSVWSILGKSMMWRLMVLVPVAAGIIALGTVLMAYPTPLLVWAMVFGVCFVSTAVLLLLLRYEGYRFVRRGVGGPAE